MASLGLGESTGDRDVQVLAFGPYSPQTTLNVQNRLKVVISPHEIGEIFLRPMVFTYLAHVYNEHIAEFDRSALLVMCGVCIR